MSFNINTYKLIKSLRPLDVFSIITRGHCDHHLPEITRQIVELRGEWYLENWNKEMKLDILKIYLSDGSFQLYTTKEEATELETEFKSWNLFYNVWFRWYGGSTYIVGFNYDTEAFEILYKNWQRDSKLKELGV